ncbi:MULTISPECIES: hypothetical protein [unclassified Comamonas]|uniref:hypothetical protein n=1 Tax=unclassified Comamonas TaxID=2638500 RepID=UPI00289DD525|nr:hypothetical protein [Comamonas sp.]
MFVSRGFGERIEVSGSSDIEAMHFDQDGLRIYIAQERDHQDIISGLIVEFAGARKFRCLDESDIADYLASPEFIHGYNVLEVLAGGWSAEIHSLSGYGCGLREWLVATGNLCISVISGEEPLIRQLRWSLDKGPQA